VHGDAAEVRLAHLLHAGRALDDLHPRLARVGAAVQRRGLDLARQRDVAGDQLAVGERDEVRRERHPHAAAELLLDLGRVPVRPHLVWGHGLVDGDEVLAVRRLAAGARDARFRVDHHVAEQSLARQRRQREDRGGRVAARVGDQPGAGDLLAMQLREPVDRVREVRGGAVLAVPLLVGGQLAQPEVGREVDDADPALEQLGNDRRGGAVRVGDDGRVDVELGRRGLEHERHARARVDGVEARPGVAARGDVAQLELRVAVQQRGRDRARVARRAEDRDASHADRPRGAPPRRRRPWRAAGRPPRR
jgi:hypothetical protein